MKPEPENEAELAIQCKREQWRIKARRRWALKRDWILALRRKSYHANRETILAREKEKRARSKELLAEQRKQRIAKDPIAHKARVAKYRASRKEKARATAKEYEKRNRKRINAYAQAYRARLSPEKKEAMLAKNREYEKRRRKKDPNFRAAYLNDPVVKARRALRQKEYYRLNKDVIRAKQIEWKQRNRERRNIRQRELWRTDPQFGLSCNLRGRVNKAMQLQGVRRDRPIEQLLGCSIPELIAHLEKSFLPGMTWQNRGRASRARQTWNIDHIKPCTAFDLTDPKQRAECFHFTNLQPMWAIDNVRKGGIRRPRVRKQEAQPVQGDFIGMLLSA